MTHHRWQWLGMILSLAGCGGGDDLAAPGDSLPPNDTPEVDFHLPLDVPSEVPPYGDGPVSITWSIQTPTGEPPQWTSYTALLYDEVSGQILTYQTRSFSSSIYATDFFAYHTAASTWTRLGGTGSPYSMCSVGSVSDVLPWPSDRHPVSQMTIDTARDRLWLYGGVCQNYIQKDMWFYSLHPTPTQNTMTRAEVSDVYFSSGGRWPENDYMGALVYSVDDDVLFSYGYGIIGGGNYQSFVFCPASAGVLSPTQTAAGCTMADAWSHVPTAAQPPLSAFPQLFYDRAQRKVFHFGREVDGGDASEIWAYDIPTQTWTNRNVVGLPMAPACCPETLMTHLTSGSGAGKFLFHQTSQASGDVATDFIYDPRTDVMSPLPSSGTGPTTLTYLTFDPSAGPNGTIVAFAHDVNGGQLWHGVLE